MHLHTLTKDNFTFEIGDSIANLNIVYHTSPRPYQKGDRVVWLCHALTANSDPLDWWSEMVGNGCCVDPDKDFVVCKQTGENKTPLYLIGHPEANGYIVYIINLDPDADNYEKISFTYP